MLSELIKNHEPSTITADWVQQFGDEHDGVIEFPGLTYDGGVIEVGYFYGDAKPKNIIDISSQVGCPSRCSFCELGAEKFSRNLSPDEMYDQVVLMLKEAQRWVDIDAIKHKVVFAKTGEPLLNRYIVDGIEKIAELGVSFKVSTIFPHGMTRRFYEIAHFASGYSEPVQMQVSLISTSEAYRREAAGIKLASFPEIREAAEYWRDRKPEGHADWRKVNLSLILTDDVPVDVNDVCDTFPPELFRFRFRNYVETEHGTDQGLVTITRERFESIKSQFEDKGYEVGDWATPTPTEQRFGLASNVTRRRYLRMIK